jgi:lysophospholipase L1-like esterase
MGEARRPRWLIRALVVVVAIVGTAGVCEMFVRLFHLEEPRFIQRDPVYGTSHIPGQAGYWKKGPTPSYIEINSKGFRGPERSYEKPPGVYRIVLIGDSYVEAFSIPYEKTLSHLLEERFIAEGYPVEVVGLGISDFGTAQELLLLEREGFRYDPDLVLLAFAHNDPANNHPRLHRSTDRPYFSLAPDGRLERLAYRPQNNSRGLVRDFLRRHLRIYTFFPKRVREAFRRIKHKTTEKGGDHPFEHFRWYASASDPLAREAWELTFGILKEFRRATEARGASFVLVDIPYQGQVVRRRWEKFLTDFPQLREAGEQFERQRPQELLSEFCRREAMLCLSLLPLFREAEARGINLYGYGDKDFHWNAEGNRVAAEAMVELLRPLVQSSSKTSPSSFPSRR